MSGTQCGNARDGTTHKGINNGIGRQYDRQQLFQQRLELADLMQRIAAQRDPDDAAFMPRKAQKNLRGKKGHIKRNAMFTKLRGGPYLKAKTTRPAPAQLRRPKFVQTVIDQREGEAIPSRCDARLHAP